MKLGADFSFHFQKHLGNYVLYRITNVVHEVLYLYITTEEH